MAIAVLPLSFLQLGLSCRSSHLSAIFYSSHHFYCRAIFITAVHFVAVKPAIIAGLHSRLDLSFFGLPFLLWSNHHIELKTFCCDYRPPLPLPPSYYLLFWLSFFSSFSRRHLLVALSPVAIHIYCSSFQACILLSSIVLYM